MSLSGVATAAAKRADDLKRLAIQDPDVLIAAVSAVALEATGPTGLQRNGIKREDLKPGDTVKVRCHALRDGSPGCLLGFLTPTHGDMARGHGIEKECD